MHQQPVNKYFYNIDSSKTAKKTFAINYFNKQDERVSLKCLKKNIRIKLH